MSIFRFAPFSLDTARYELTNDGKAVELPRLPMDILVMLLERGGDLLTRGEIASRIWPESDPADVVPRISNAINRIRNSLGDDPTTPLYVQTVIGKGYRFVAPVLIEGRAEPSATQQATLVEGIESPAPELLLAAKVEDVTRRRPWFWLFALFAVTISAGAWIAVRSFHRVPIPAADPYTLSRFTSNQNGDRVTAAAISPDGRSIAYADADGVRLRRLDEGDSHPVPTPSLREVDRLAWFPDGTHLALSGVEKDSDLPEIWLIGTRGDPPVLWRKDARQASPASVGTRIAFTDASGSEIWVADDLIHPPLRLLQGQHGEAFSALAWTSNGKTLLVGHRSGDAKTPASRFFRDVATSYLALNSDTGAITAAVENLRMNEAFVAPGGKLMFTRQEEDAVDLWEVPVDTETGAFLRPPRQVQSLQMNVSGFSIASTGTIAAVRQLPTPVISVGEFHQDSPSLDHIQPLTFSIYAAYPHSWTPDSKSIYFEQRVEQPSAHNYRLLKQALGAHDPEALTDQPNDQAFPLLTPDHKWILFIGRDDFNLPYQLFRLSTEKGKPELVPTKGPMGEIRCPLVGHTCVLRRAESRQHIVFYELDPVSGIGKVLWQMPWISDELGGWDVSPDGSRLAFANTDSHQPALRIVGLATGAVSNRFIPVHSRVAAVRWAVNQRGWLITTSTLAGADLFYMDTWGKGTLLHQTPQHSWMVPSPDGHKLAFVDQTTDSNVWLLKSRTATRR